MGAESKRFDLKLREIQHSQQHLYHHEIIKIDFLSPVVNLDETWICRCDSEF